MANQATQPDSGYRDHRIEFVRENAPGETPADPAWEAYSDNHLTAIMWEADAQYEGLRGVGTADPRDHLTGPEDHTLTVEYHLQRFFVDSNGDPLDASGDAILRDADNSVSNTHTIVDRADYGSTRTYLVAKGAYPNVDEMTGDPGSGLPIAMAMEYEAKDVRLYKVGQPSSEQLSVSSTSSNDTTQTVTIESDNASTTDTVSLNGTTAVLTEDDTGSAITFDSIDAIELDAETEGDVVIEGNSSAEELARLDGTSSYNGSSGDLGIPALGAGSHAGTVGTAYESFLDDEITKGGNSLAAEVRSAGFSVDNNYEKAGVMGTTEMAVHPGDRNLEFTATVAGNFEGHEHLSDHVQNNSFDITWTFDGGTVTFKNAVLLEPGEVGPEAGAVVSTLENTFEPRGVNITSN